MKKFRMLQGLLVAGWACASQAAATEPGTLKVSVVGPSVEAAAVKDYYGLTTPVSTPIQPVTTVSGPAVSGPTISRQPVAAQTVRPMPISTPIDVAPAMPMDDEGNGACRHLVASFDFLWMSARGDSIPFAQIKDGVGPLAVPVGPVGILDSAYGPGFRAAAGLQNGRAEIGGRFTWWEDRSSSSLEVPVGQPAVIHALTVFPATLNAALDSLVADAHQDIHLLMGDVDFKYQLCGNDCSWLKVILGGRYAHLDENFSVVYSLLGGTRVKSDINFDGGGPRVGLEGAYTVFGRVFVYGRSDFTFAYGHFGANYLQQNVFIGTQAATNSGDDRVVPILDTEVGLGWRSRGGRVEVTAGYTGSNWFNSMTTSNWIEGVQNSAFATNRNNLSDTLSFDGVFVRVGFKY